MSTGNACNCCINSNVNVPICDLTHLNKYGVVDNFYNHEWAITLNLGGFINGTFIWTPQELNAGQNKIFVSPNLLGNTHRSVLTGFPCSPIDNFIDGTLTALNDNTNPGNIWCDAGGCSFAVASHSFIAYNAITTLISYSMLLTQLKFTITCNLVETLGTLLPPFGRVGFTFIAEYDVCNYGFNNPPEAFTGCGLASCTVVPIITDGLTYYLGDNIVSGKGIYTTTYCPDGLNNNVSSCCFTPLPVLGRGPPSVETALIDLINLPTSIEVVKLV